MTEAPTPKLSFRDLPGGDCAVREVVLPSPLPQVGDDFDWMVRDYDSIRRFMLEELAARVPERTRWTASDVEVVLVEVFAAVLDQLSDMIDRVAAERYLDSARRPESVRRLLRFIGYDAVREAGLLPPGPSTEQAQRRAEAELERSWARQPGAMEAARRAGPQSVHRQHRMVGVGDYGELVEEHPLVYRAVARRGRSGSWTKVEVVIVARQEVSISRRVAVSGEDVVEGPGELLSIDAELAKLVELFHARRGLRLPKLDGGASLVAILGHFVEPFRMIGHQVVLVDATFAALELTLRVRIGPHYFRSELSHALRRVLGAQPGGFFEHGRLGFGEDIHASDIIQVVMALDGVEDVVIESFKRAGGRHREQATAGVINLDAHELAVCDADPERPERGTWVLALEGGRVG